MPRGSYLHLDPLDGTPVAAEDFSCAAGPVGWRYVAVLRAPAVAGEPAAAVSSEGSPDLAGADVAGADVAGADVAGAADVGTAEADVAGAGSGPEVGRIDLTLDAGGRQVRLEVTGGGWRLRGGVAGAEMVWLRSAADGSAAVERAAVATGFTGRSPAFLVATAKRLGLSPGGRARARLVALTEPALGTQLVTERWSLRGVTEHVTETGPLPVARYEIADLDTGEVRTVHIAGDVVVAATTLELTALTSPPSR